MVGVVAAVVVVDVVVVVGAAVGVFVVVVVAAALVVAVVVVETNLKELAVEVEQQILVQELLVFVVVVGNVLRNAVGAAVVAGLRGWWVG